MSKPTVATLATELEKLVWEQNEIKRRQDEMEAMLREIYDHYCYMIKRAKERKSWWQRMADKLLNR